MTTVLSVIFSGWHPHHLGQTGHLHQGVVLPQQSGLQRSSFSSPLVRRDHNLEQVTARGSWRPNSRMFKRFYYYYCDITSDFVYLFLGENKYFGVFEYVKTQCMSFEPNTFPVWAEKQGILGCVISDSVSQKRSYRFGNLTDSHSHSLKKKLMRFFSL